MKKKLYLIRRNSKCNQRLNLQEILQTHTHPHTCHIYTLPLLSVSLVFLPPWRVHCSCCFNLQPGLSMLRTLCVTQRTICLPLIAHCPAPVHTWLPAGNKPLERFHITRPVCTSNFPSQQLVICSRQGTSAPISEITLYSFFSPPTLPSSHSLSLLFNSSTCSVCSMTHHTRCFQ